TPAIDEDDPALGLDRIAVDPRRGGKRQESGYQVDAVVETAGIGDRPVHSCSTASRIAKVTSIVTSNAVVKPEASTFPQARTRSLRVRSEIVAAARASTVRTASAIESGELPVSRIVFSIRAPPCRLDIARPRRPLSSAGAGP